MVHQTELQRDKMKRLFSYLRELSHLKLPLVRDINRYEEVLFLDEIPIGEEYRSTFSNGRKEDTWIQIENPSFPEFPSVPNLLDGWLDPNVDIQVSKPVLLMKMNNTYHQDKDEKGDRYSDEDFSKVISIFSRYVEDWQSWNEENIRIRRMRKVYKILFSIYQHVKKRGEEVELVMAIGLLNWKTPEGQHIHRHLVVKKVEVYFDSTTGVIKVVPSVNMNGCELEQDIIGEYSRLDSLGLQAVNRALLHLERDFWNEEKQSSVLQLLVQSLCIGGYYVKSVLNEVRDYSEVPMVTSSPALILRKRSEKSFQQACSTIVEQLEGNNIVVPQGILPIFDEIGGIQQESSISTVEEKGYVPLEVNEEQMRILKSVYTQNGVLVQAPPGTGKKHTIANLVTHFLSTGQRVLVVSQTSRVLSGIKEKLPKGLQDLCVSLLDKEALKNLEHVVQRISFERDHWKEETVQQSILEHTKKIEKLKGEQAQIEHELSGIYKKETVKYSVIKGKYEGSAMEIARELCGNRKKYSWFTDKIDAHQVLTITKKELFELLSLRSQLNEESQIQFDFPSKDTLLPFETFNALVEQERILLEELVQLQPYQNNVLSELDEEELSEVVYVCERFIHLLNELEIYDGEWITRVKDDIHQSDFSLWKTFYEEIGDMLNKISELSQKHPGGKVTGYTVSKQQLLSDAKKLKKYALSGRGKGFLFYRPKVIKETAYLTKRVRVNGMKCTSVEVLQQLEDVIEMQLYIEQCKEYIEQKLGVLPQVQFTSIATLTYMKELLKPLSTLHSLKENIERAYSIKNFQLLLHENQFNQNHFSSIVKSVRYVTCHRELQQIQGMLQNKVNQLAINDHSLHPVVNMLKEAIDIRHLEGYQDGIKCVEELEQFIRLKERFNMLLKRLKEEMPNLHESFIKESDVSIWKNRFEQIEDAFDYGKVSTWFETFSEKNEKELVRKLTSVDKEMEKNIRHVCEMRSWYYTFKNMTEVQRQHLIAWNISMKKIENHREKNHWKYMQDARRHIDRFQDAIPAWIMPFFQVFDYFEVKPNLFDIVIIDEASQLGPQAIILQYLAKKIIVIGDDKQISAEYIENNQDEVHSLQDQYLYDVPLGNLLDAENSLFDLANVLYGGRITLRDHFRCMPEIIRFSNQISYQNTPLIPMKQYGLNYLAPIKTRHIPLGFQDGRGQKIHNRPEAEAIVEEVKSCVENIVYEGKTIGIISLEGEWQAQLIQNLLIERIGIEEFEKRNIICSDVDTFQGDERDIIFISLVVSSHEISIKSLTTDKDRCRFNVAVSCAKEQLWLFHTPSENDFKNKDCLRYQLISYCQNPHKDERIEESGKYNSKFEEDVVNEIIGRGYRIIRSYEEYELWSQFIIEGEQNRIVVECIGDKWASSDRYKYIRDRQRLLESYGWTFWRIRGSEYYSNPEQALKPLWILLGINTVPASELKMTTINKHSRKSEHMNEKVSAGVPSLINEFEKGLDLVDYFTVRGFEVIDKRSNGGALWVVADDKLEMHMKRLQDYDIHIQFSKKGGRVTGNQPAWYTKDPR